MLKKESWRKKKNKIDELKVEFEPLTMLIILMKVELSYKVDEVVVH